MGVLNTNPVTKTSVDNGLSPEGKQQVARAVVELQRLEACSRSCWIWPSITQRAYQAAEIIASVNGIDRSRIVPEYSFLDARGLGALEGRSLDAIFEVYAFDKISPNNKPPPITDGTPNESVSDVFVRVTQLMSILETQYSEQTIVIISPDSDNLSILLAGLTGVDLRRIYPINWRNSTKRVKNKKNWRKYESSSAEIITVNFMENATSANILFTKFAFDCGLLIVCLITNNEIALIK
ncbi:uncharacterized protein LOC110093346 [Dendrobium catenatum]|uniref:uncharacterized protein LOC110093346 n=1 Tax=Dendrobium catenatum TaxID=906689 RepID=UPI00109EFDE8|nr:uncharacterized protein LOC110093346 [Dendrobium catenatum]